MEAGWGKLRQVEDVIRAALNQGKRAERKSLAIAERGRRFSSTYRIPHTDIGLGLKCLDGLLKSKPIMMISGPMTPEHQQDLFKRYPELFRERHLTQYESGMHLGIDCVDAWMPIIDAVCATIVQHSACAPHPVPAVKKIKQKFGSLRFQVDLAVQCEFCRGAIEMARMVSERIPGDEAADLFLLDGGTAPRGVMSE
jgi:hypothetical protein